jgi:hypothetical protein
MKRIQNKKKLELDRQTLRSLTRDQLDEVGGASAYCKAKLPSLQDPTNVGVCTVC